jgi:methylaspartate mutase sigma subunit
MEKKKLVIGVLMDNHNLGVRVLKPFLERAGFEVIYIGARLNQEDFLRAALETDADAVLVSSSCGHAELDARGMRDKFREAGLEHVRLYIGGNLVVAQQNRTWNDVARMFQEMGFDRAYSSSVSLDQVIKDFSEDLRVQPAGGADSPAAGA